MRLFASLFLLTVNYQLSTVNYFCGMYGKSVPGK